MATLQSLLSKYESLKSAWEKKNLSECGKLLAEFKVQLLIYFIFNIGCFFLSLAICTFLHCYPGLLSMEKYFRIAGGAGQMWKWGRVSSD